MSQSVLGTVNLHITNLSADTTPSSISEKEVIADPTTPNVKNTVLMGTGYKRNRYTVEGNCSIAELSSLLTYKNAKSANTFTAYFDGTQIVSESCVIDKLGWSIAIGAKRVTLSMTLIQA
jgi:hypothetical protein